MFRLIFVFCVLILSSVVTYAQYHLGEIGVQVGGGLSIPTDNNELGSLTASPGMNLNAFYSHYICGKSYGYHLNLGFRTLWQQEKKHTFETEPGYIPYYQGFVLYQEFGAYLKIRPKNYHRPKELCLLVGPKFNIKLYEQTHSENITIHVYNETSTFLYGLHLSLMQRLPLNKHQSFFVSGGTDFFPFTKFKGIETGFLYLHLNLGLAFWSSR